MRYDRMLLAMMLGWVLMQPGALATAQRCECHLDQSHVELVRERMRLGVYDSGSITRPTEFMVVQVKWHVLTDTSGNASIDATTLDDYLVRLSQAFAPAGIEFCADPEIDFISDNTLFANVQNTYELRTLNSTEDAIDVYWCPSVQGGGLCGSSSYTFSPVQGVVMQTSCQGAKDVSGVLIHEIGHYFDLFHTHELNWGFDCPNGTLCSEVGDLVCDTAPSRNMLFETCVDPTDCSLRTDESSCIEGYPEPLCDGSPFLESETRNFMSYSPVHCLLEFTPGQYDRMNATYWNLRPELQAGECSQVDRCPADLTEDGLVNGGDIAVILTQWGTEDDQADLDGSGTVNGADLAVMLNSWGLCW